MFTFTITAYVRNLKNLKAILEKAKVWQVEHKISDETIMNARLALDQFPLASQVRTACNFARNSGAVILGVEHPVYEDNEKTLTDLQDRIDKVIAYLEAVTPETVQVDLETRMVPIVLVPGKGLTTKYFLEVYAHENFYFHYITAYAILRHYGLSIGKGDYMTNIEFKDLPK